VSSAFRAKAASGGRRHASLIAVFLGFFLFGAAWAFAAPFDGSPDEAEHIIRAAGVVRGQVAPPPEDAANGIGAFQKVPKSLQRACWLKGEPTLSAKCRAFWPTNDETEVVTASRAGRYNPVYYAIVGWPLIFAPTMKGVLLARLMSVALVAFGLTLAVHAARLWSRHRVMLGGILLVATPTAMNLAGSINPSAPEIAGAILAFAALVPLLDPDREPSPLMVHLAGIGGLMLVIPRALGPGWLALGVGILLVPNTRAHIRRLLAMTAVRVWIGVLGVVSIASGLWTVIQQTGEPGVFIPVDSKLTTLDAVQYVLLVRSNDYLEGMFRALSGGEIAAWRPVVTLWLMAIGLTVMGAFVFGRWVDRWRMGATLGALWAFTAYGEITTANELRFPTQGRYLLPMFALVVFLAGEVLARTGTVDALRARAMTRFFAVLTAGLHLVQLCTAMTRWQAGLSGDWLRPRMSPLSGDWHPGLGSANVLILAVVGLAVLIVGFWRISALPPSAAPEAVVEPAVDEVPEAAAPAGEAQAARTPEPAVQT
jgi:hypothetical protein